MLSCISCFFQSPWPLLGDRYFADLFLHMVMLVQHHELMCAFLCFPNWIPDQTGLQYNFP